VARWLVGAVGTVARWVDGLRLLARWVGADGLMG